VSYNIIGQASKYIPVGAIRVAVQSNNNAVKSTGFVLPNGKKAGIFVNTGGDTKLKLTDGKKQINFDMPAQSASTIVW